MYEQMWPWLHLVSRILFASVFLTSAWSHFTQTDALAGYAASKKVPAPRMMTLLTGAMMLVGATLVLLGWHRFIGAGLLFLFVFPTAFVMHNYWTVTDPGMRANDRAHFFKDISLAGGALFVAACSGYYWPL